MQTDRIVVLTKRLSLCFDKMANPILAKYDLTTSQYKILKYLFNHKEETVIQVNIEKNYSMTRQTTIGLLEQLEKKNYVERKRNPKDSRSNIVVLTKKARKMEKELYAVGEQLDQLFVKPLSASEQKQLRNLQRKLLDGLEKEV